jgi:hypothetical protein
LPRWFADFEDEWNEKTSNEKTPLLAKKKTRGVEALGADAPLRSLLAQPAGALTLPTFASQRCRICPSTSGPCHSGKRGA